MRSGSSRIARNVLVTLATQLITWGLSFWVTLWIPSYMGQRGLGMFGVASAFTASFVILVELGTGPVLTKEIARNHSRLAEMVATTLVLRLGLGLLTIPLGVGAAYLLHYDALQIQMILLGLCAMTMGQLTLVLITSLQGLEDFPRSNGALLADKVLASLLMIALVQFRQPLWAFMIVPMVGTLVSGSFAFAGIVSHVRRNDPESLPQRPPGETRRALVGIGGPVLVGTLLFAVVQNLELRHGNGILTNEFRQPLRTTILLLMTGILIIAGLTLASISFRARRASIPPAILPNKEKLWAMASAGLPIMVGMLLFSVWEPGNKVLLSKLSGIEVVSWYELAKRLGGTTMVIPVALVGATLPAMSRTFHANPQEFRNMTARLMRLLLICVVPFAAILLFAPEPLLALLHYLPKFRQTIPVLQIMGCAIIIWYLSQVAAGALIASDQQKAFGRITGTAAVLCLPLCAGCILAANRLWNNGALGAVIADVLIEICMLSGYLRVLPRGTLTLVDMTILIRAMAAALPLIWLLHQVHNARELYLAAPGLLLYPVLCALLRCLDARDLQMLRQGWNRKVTRASA